MQLLILLTFILAGSQRQSDPVSSDASKWPRFRDELHRFSFAHPTELRPITSPPEELRGLSGWMTKVVLVPDAPKDAETWPVLQVSVFGCDDPSLSPRAPCQDETSYRRFCDRFEKFALGDAMAIQCVTYGRGACSWQAVVLREKHRVEISAPAANRALQETTTTRPACADAVVTTRTQPLLREMLASFQFR